MRQPCILVRSSWQTVNIGDIAHTPGLLALLETHVPEARVILWASSVDSGVDAMLRRRFPELRIVVGADAARQAMDESDLLLHGSGPFVVAARDLIEWRAVTGRPYGICGVTLSDVDPLTAEAIDHAEFAFFRDSASLARARARSNRSPRIEFGPDAAFAADVRDDAAAEAFLRSHGLEEGRFLCCIPRLRYTPYWQIKPVAIDPAKDARNTAMKEHDHVPLREAITALVRQTGLKVLLCPEDRTQMAVGRELLLEPLPADVRAQVVWRENYWLTDEALSTYVRSAGLFGNEMHSPIMCIGHGVPAVVCRWSEQTTKGLMWRDIGLGEWLFDLDDPHDHAKVVPTVLSIACDPQSSRAQAVRAREFVRERQAEMCGAVRQVLHGTGLL